MHRVEVQRRKKSNGSLDEATIAQLEREVRDTYYKHDLELSNPGARQQFEADGPRLDGDQQEVLGLLQRDGLAVIPFTKLFDGALWDDLQTYSASFEARSEADLADPTRQEKAKKKLKDGAKALAKAAGKEKPAKKKFVLLRALKHGTEIGFDNPWLRMGASPRLLDIVNTYLGLWTKLSYVDQWYTAPGGSEAERLGSQRWHRDYNDQHLLKAFLYMSDVDLGSGPFEYVPGSAKGGPYENEWPWQPLGDTYPDPDEFTRRIPADAVKTLTAPKGTLVLCNTSGFHRGGFCTERRRVVGVLNYVSPASLESLVERNFTLDPSQIPADAPQAVRFALT